LRRRKAASARKWEPPGAAVEIDGEAAGETPYAASWPRGEDEREVRLALPGYEEQRLRLRPRATLTEQVKLVKSKREDRRGRGARGGDGSAAKKREPRGDKKALDQSYNPFGS
jgi:hypothetical protein